MVGSCLLERSRRFMRQFFLGSRFLGVLSGFLLFGTQVCGGEADINIPPLDPVRFGGVSGYTLLYSGLVVCVLGALFGLWQYAQTRALPVHRSMSDVSNIIWET